MVSGCTLTSSEIDNINYHFAELQKQVRNILNVDMSQYLVTMIMFPISHDSANKCISVHGKKSLLFQKLKPLTFPF